MTDPPEYAHPEDPPAAVEGLLARLEEPIWARGSHVLIGETEEGIRCFIASGTEEEMADRAAEYPSFGSMIIAKVVEVIG